jgi:hypothetical protein
MSEVYISQSLNEIRLKLLDLTKRNRLLNFRRNKSTIFIVDEQPKQVFQRIANDGNSMTFMGVPEPTLRDLKEIGIEGDSVSLRRNKDALRTLVANRQGIDLNEELPLPDRNEESLKKHSDNFLQTGLFMPELETRLRRIRSEARSYIEETGQNRLFLAFGFLQWTEREDLTTKYEAPLILLPVELTKGKIDSKTRCYRYSVNYTGEDLIHNLSLAEKLKRDFDLILPTFDDREVVNRFNGDEELDPEKYFASLQKTIKPFTNWNVSRKVVLGFFTFSKLLMYLDLDPDRWPEDKNIIDHSLIGNLLLGREDPSSGLSSTEDKFEEDEADDLALVVDADSSQTEAIINSLEGRDIIIEGPPGTGKSQTITNLIACFLQENKRVLFVSEKMAALNVVHRNLSQVGLADFCLQLHSHKANKKGVLDDLKQRSKKRFSRPKNHKDHLTQLKHLRDLLSQYVDLIQSRWGPDKDTLFDIVWKIEEIQSRIEQNPAFRVKNIEALSVTDVQERKLLLEQLASFIEQLGKPTEHHLFGYSPVNLYYNDQESFKQQCRCTTGNVNQVIDVIDEFNQKTSMGIPSKELTFKELEALVKINHNPLPENFLPELYDSFYRFSLTEKWDMYHKLIDMIHDYQNYTLSASKILDLNRSDDLNSLKENRKCLKLIQQNHLGNLRVKAANDISIVVTNLINLIKKIAPLTQQQVADGMICPKNINDLLKFLTVDALLREKPTEVSNEILHKFFSSRYRENAEKILETGLDLLKEQKRLSEQFDLSLCPDADQLPEYRKIMRLNHGKIFAFLSSDYRAAKKTLLGFIRNPKLIKKTELIDELEKLENHFNSCQSFIKQDSYNKLLGDLFQGVNSDWDKLKDALYWASQLLKQVNSSIIAIQLVSIQEDQLSQWAKHHEIESLKDDIIGELESFSEILKETPYLEQLADFNSLVFEGLSKRLINFQVLFGHVQQHICPMVNSSETLLDDINKALHEYIQALEIKQAIENHPDYPVMFGPHFKGVETLLDELKPTVEWLYEFSRQPLPPQIADILNQQNITLILSQ